VAQLDGKCGVRVGVGMSWVGGVQLLSELLACVHIRMSQSTSAWDGLAPASFQHLELLDDIVRPLALVL
jgi:hypothetical protein